MRAIVAQWVPGLFSHGLIIEQPQGDPLCFRLSKRHLRRVSKGLYSLGTRSRFADLANRNPEFIYWWGESLSDHETAYVFDVAKGGWQVPWELLLERRTTPQHFAKTCIVRRTGKRSHARPERFADPLRILFLEGGSRGLDLAAELTRIRNARAMLPPAARCRVADPEHVRVTKSSLHQDIKRVQPHVLWFSGHGEYRKRTRLQMSDGEWINADQLCSALRQANTVPCFCVFLACSTAAASGSGPAEVRPDLVGALHDLGVHGADPFAR